MPIKDLKSQFDLNENEFMSFEAKINPDILYK